MTSREDSKRSAQKTGKKVASMKKGWGVEDLPFPVGVAYIQVRWDLCIGCGKCEEICLFLTDDL